MSSRLARIALAILAALVLSATGPGWAAARDDRANVIEVKDHDRVEPSLLRVAAGTTVTWRNVDGATHRIRDDRGTFDSGSLRKDASYSRRFDTGGTYTYSLGTLVSGSTWSWGGSWNGGGTWHWMSVGSVVVSGAVAAPAPSAPSPIVGGTTPAPPPAPAAALASVDILDNSFSPARLTVTAGTTVTWTNRGRSKHTVTSASGAFDSRVLSSGATFAFTLSNPGTYGYVCDLHSGMTGTVVVTGTAQGTTPTAAPVPTPAVGTPLPGAQSPAAPPSGAATVQILDNSFSPATLTIAAGTTVTWTNLGSAKHTVTSAAFDSGILASGASWSHTFTASGTSSYVCDLHSGMSGTIVVTGTASAAAPAPAPTPSPSRATGSRPGARTIVIADNVFEPGTIRVQAGTTVVWVNHGVVKHTATSRGSAFDSGILSPNGEFSVTFGTPGTYPYICDLHPGMSGSIEVYALDGTTPPATVGDAAAPAQPATSNDTALPATYVAMGDDVFSPRALRVATGTTVTWTNGGLAKHTVTARDGSFSSALLGSGQTYSRAFTKAGTYAYLCSLHPAMIGTIDVTDATAVAAAAPVARANVGTVGRPPTAPGGDIGAGIAAAFALLLAAGAAVAIGSRLATLQPSR